MIDVRGHHSGVHRAKHQIRLLAERVHPLGGAQGASGYYAVFGAAQRRQHAQGILPIGGFGEVFAPAPDHGIGREQEFIGRELEWVRLGFALAEVDGLFGGGLALGMGFVAFDAHGCKRKTGALKQFCPAGRG